MRMVFSESGSFEESSMSYVEATKCEHLLILGQRTLEDEPRIDKVAREAKSVNQIPKTRFKDPKAMALNIFLS